MFWIGNTHCTTVQPMFWIANTHCTKLQRMFWITNTHCTTVQPLFWIANTHCTMVQLMFWLANTHCTTVQKSFFIVNGSYKCDKRARRIAGVSFFCAHLILQKGASNGHKKRYNRIAGPARRAIIQIKNESKEEYSYRNKIIHFKRAN